MLGSLRSVLAAILILHTTGLPAMLKMEEHHHYSCLCLLSKEACKHIKRNNNNSPLDKLAEDRAAISFCNCHDDSAASSESGAQLNLIFQNTNQLLGFFPSVIYLGIVSWVLPTTPFRKIWSPPS